jgi:septum formation protein
MIRSDPVQPRLVLASASPRRRELLTMLGMDFTVHPSEAEAVLEDLPDEPEVRVRFLARQKARQVAEAYADALILGADTVVAVPGRILEKPSDRHEAVKMLRQLSGGWHQVYSGICLIDKATGREVVDSVKTDVHFLPLTDAQIQSYVNTGEPLDKAGAYGIQGQAAVFIDEIHGCYYNVVGLPLARLAQILSGFGIELPKG